MIAPFNRTLDQELAALVRGASLECLVCGEFVLQARGALEFSVLACPECKSLLVEGEELPEVELPSIVQAG